MLKIKDNVDLKELEKYGFEEFINRVLPHNNFYSVEKELEESGQIHIRTESRDLFTVGGLDLNSAELLYDLIMDGLVEKY